ncbi:hypothetical protein Ciccas_013735 [Cichlidogyrus casuarinus]|uniref:Uncharacterized protein n=1 Tax=Cichlidogyrus casuarinus TaxID=1844966 RepID=A0ABD2PPU1_9PLAT
MSHDRQQTLHLISCLMQQVLCYATPSVASLLTSTDCTETANATKDDDDEDDENQIIRMDQLSKENSLVVDKIFYGTDQFPKNLRQFVGSGTFVSGDAKVLKRKKHHSSNGSQNLLKEDSSNSSQSTIAEPMPLLSPKKRQSRLVETAAS